MVGSSTIVATATTNNAALKILTNSGYDFSTALSGAAYTVVLTEYNTNIGGQYNADLLPDLSSYLTTGLDTHGLAQAPNLLLQVIHFTYSPDRKSVV